MDARKAERISQFRRNESGILVIPAAAYIIAQKISKGVIMDQRVTTEQLIYKIGALTLENDILRAQVERLQQQIAELTKVEEKLQPTAKTSFGSISD